MTTKSPELTGPNKEVIPFETDSAGRVPGTTEIARSVVAAIAGYAAEQIEGVVSVGSEGLLRSVASLVESKASKRAAGVDVEMGVKEAIFDIDLVVQYGDPIPGIVKNAREAVALALMDHVGLVAKEINVTVIEIKFDDRNTKPGRVK